MVTLTIGAALSACGTPQPPRPPGVDGSTTRPANDPQQIEIIRLQGQVKNLRLDADQNRQQRLEAAPVPARPPSPPPNEIYVFNFETGHADVNLPVEEFQPFLQAAKASPYIVIRGRTDDGVDTTKAGRIARLRAANMESFLVGAGVDPARLRVTFQPIGDRMLNDTSAVARGLNRRVEVELYASMPKTLLQGSATGATLSWDRDHAN